MGPGLRWVAVLLAHLRRLPVDAPDAQQQRRAAAWLVQGQQREVLTGQPQHSVAFVVLATAGPGRQARQGRSASPAPLQHPLLDPDVRRHGRVSQAHP